jgi:outer membrane protein
MKRIFAVAVLLASGFALAANAQTTTKVAVIAFQGAVAQTNEGQRDFADLQKKFDPKRQQLKTLSDEIENLKKQLQAQADKLSDQERASRAKTIDDKTKQFQREGEDAQNDFQSEMQEVYGTLASKVYDVLADYAKKQGFTVVIDVSSQQTPVLYADESTNITKAIIDGYNVKSGVPAPPAGTGGPAAPTTAPHAAPKTAPAK